MTNRSRIVSFLQSLLMLSFMGVGVLAADLKRPLGHGMAKPQAQRVLDVALAQVPKTGGHDDLALVMGESFVRLLTLDPTSGNQRGRTIEVAYPPNPCLPPNPCKGIISKYVLPGHVIILNRDYMLFWMPVSLDMDGTPILGPWQCSPPLDGGALGNGATALTELPGSLFRDGQPRLYIGNEEGLIIKVVLPTPGPPEIDGYIGLLIGNPIRSLAPIPQLGYVALGASTGTVLYGISEASGTPEITFERIWPPNPCVDFEVFESIEYPPDPGSPIHLLYSTETPSPGPPEAEIPFDAAGSGPLVTLPTPGPPDLPAPPLQLALGSLLFVTADSTGVYYDPGYAQGSGFSSCLVNLTSGSSNGCLCCFGSTGNVDCDPSDGTDISDLSALIDNLYISFSPVCCPAEANTDGDLLGGVDISDLSALIDYLYISFTPPAACQ